MKKGILLIWTLVLVGLGIGFCVLQWPAYLRYKETRAMRRAQILLGARDFANASVSAHLALQLNPRNLEACRVMAELSELARSSAAIDWRRRAVEIAPTITNQLDLAGTALRFEHPPFQLAAETLEGVAEVGQDIPAFQVLSALVDLKANRTADALAHFRNAARLDPSNPVHRLNCAVLELQSTDDTVAGPAASELDRLTLRTNLQALSLRSLAAERLRRHDWSGARRYSDRLIQLPSCALEDQLMHLTVLQGVEFQAKQTGTTAQVSRSGVPVPDPPDEAPSTATSQSGVNPGSGFTDHLDRIQTHAGNNILEIYAVSEWMGAHGLAAQGLEWLERMDPKICKAQPIPLARANLYAALRDWAKLETFLHRAEWQEMEFLRQAFLARTAWGQNQEPSGDARWRCAVRSAGNRLGALMFLFKLGEEWSKDPEELLLAIWRGFPREKWAVAQLEQHYLATGNTRGLNRIYASRVDDIACASDITNRNDFACTSLLLGVDLPRAHALARQLYRERPDDVILASTYAYSLQVQGEIHEALAVFATFDEPTLETPAVALYYGLMLAKTGEAKRAQHFLRCAERVKLSPEESQLLHDAKRALP